MNDEYLTDYEKHCMGESLNEIKKRYPLIPLMQIEEDIEVLKSIKDPWELAKFRRFLRSVSSFVYRYRLPRE